MKVKSSSIERLGWSIGISSNWVIEKITLRYPCHVFFDYGWTHMSSCRNHTHGLWFLILVSLSGAEHEGCKQSVYRILLDFHDIFSQSFMLQEHIFKGVFLAICLYQVFSNHSIYFLMKIITILCNYTCDFENN